MKVNIVDTTLRDGEQTPGISLNVEDKIKIAKLLEAAGVCQIEAGVPAMGGQEKESIKEIMGLSFNCIISSWNRMNIKDIKASQSCGVNVIHISVPVSDIQIKSKLGKDKNWVVEKMINTVSFASQMALEVIVGFEDASRSDMNFILKLCRILKLQGVKRIRYADTVGILTPSRTYEVISQLGKKTELQIEAHMHNDFGMAVANSISAVYAGAEYVGCTFGGIGERTGNCNYTDFMKALYKNKDLSRLDLIEGKVNSIITQRNEGIE